MDQIGEQSSQKERLANRLTLEQETEIFRNMASREGIESLTRHIINGDLSMLPLSVSNPERYRTLEKPHILGIDKVWFYRVEGVDRSHSSSAKLEVGAYTEPEKNGYFNLRAEYKPTRRVRQISTDYRYIETPSGSRVVQGRTTILLSLTLDADNILDFYEGKKQGIPVMIVDPDGSIRDILSYADWQAEEEHGEDYRSEIEEGLDDPEMQDLMKDRIEGIRESTEGGKMAHERSPEGNIELQEKVAALFRLKREVLLAKKVDVRATYEKFLNEPLDKPGKIDPIGAIVRWGSFDKTVPPIVFSS